MLSHNDDSISHSITWHTRLGHIGQDIMANSVRAGFVDLLAKVQFSKCELCLAKKGTTPFWKSKRASSILELVHPDFPNKKCHGMP